MDEQEWLSSKDPQAMLAFLRDSGKANERKLRLFACACCRNIWPLVTDQRSRKAVAVAEQYADGAIDFVTLKGACEGPNKPRKLVRDLLLPEAWRVADFVAFHAAGMAADCSPEGVAYMEERLTQCRLLKDVLGNPFRTSSIHPSRLKANHGRVRKLARQIYDDHSFERMPELAQALHDASCDDAELLAHLRGPGPHAKGCFALDVLLGRE